MSEVNKSIDLTEIGENKDYSFDDWTSIIDNKLKTDELNYILNNLSGEEYQIFTKFYYYSQKTKKIAKELDISDVKVKTKLHRIRNKIKKKLKERGYSI